MSKNMWVGLVCCFTLLLLVLSGRGVAKDIGKDVDMSTKIGCGIPESAGRVKSGPEEGRYGNPVEENRGIGEMVSGDSSIAQCLMALGMVIDEIAKFGDVIRLSMT